MEREEAINLIKQVLPCLNIDEKIREGFVTLIPELKESEDERIRKELIGYLTHRAEVTGFIDEDKDCKRWITYFEKQKEQKPESCDCSRDEESYTNGIHHVLMNPEAYGLIKQKPAEWSEEDKHCIHQLILFCENCMQQDSEAIRCATWLKSLRPQSKQKQNDYITPHKEFFKFIYDRLINVHKENPNVDYMRSFKERLNNLSFGEKQEWSEEDEEMLNSCISSIEESKENRYAYKETDGDTSYDREIDWLKSLRNRVGKEFLQPHWKPSEEQMEAIENVIKCELSAGLHTRANILQTLQNELKKL